MLQEEQRAERLLQLQRNKLRQSFAETRECLAVEAYKAFFWGRSFFTDIQGECLKLKNTQPIKLNRDFRRLYAKGKSVAGGFVVVYARRTNRNVNRVGFTVSKSLGNAVVRNRTKRLMRESYRLMEDKLDTGYDMIIVARNRAAGKTYEQISKDLSFVLHSLGIISGVKK